MEVVLSVIIVLYVVVLGVSLCKSVVVMGDVGEYSSGFDWYEFEVLLM